MLDVDGAGNVDTFGNAEGFSRRADAFAFGALGLTPEVVSFDLDLDCDVLGFLAGARSCR